MRAANKHAAPVARVADDDRAADQAALCVADRHGSGDERMTSTNTMIDRLAGCLGTGDLSQWEEGFVRSLVERKEAGQVTRLTERQIETLDRLHSKHFAG